MIINKLKIWPGRTYPLGATWDGRGVNFTLFSAHAERVELCLFDESGLQEVARVALPEYDDQVWHGYVHDLRPGTLYGYRVYGPYDPHRGHRFNHHKLLLDPYAKELRGHLRIGDIHHSYRLGDPKADLSFDKRDNTHDMPKCVVVDPSFDWHNDRPPRVPWPETMIYEAHVRGFTMLHEGLPSDQRGTFLGMAHQEVVAYLKALGITSVELMPVHAFADEPFLLEKDLHNYWGYNSFAFFAPEARYLGHAGLTSFKTMVERLHEAGIEVLLDVVYNHTAEGNHLGPTLNFRGIDNASYYRLQPDDRRFYINDTGCGNTLNLTHPRVLQMVMDSLRYWVTEMHVDGFRFDLAATLGREEYGYDRGSGFFDAIRQDPVLSNLKLIAEPWDIGPGGYQLGSFPPGSAEWNDRFRDNVRRYWRGDEGTLGGLASTLLGSSDIFEHDDRRPWASINYVASHDGFTLADVVSYQERHNFVNGEDNKDGHPVNFSANYGTEGPTDDTPIIETRLRQRRNMLATVFLAQGTPMLLAGDEFGRTQNGNNNAYCQDNPISWINWNILVGREVAFLDFVRRLIRLRRQHPVLRRPRFLHGLHRSETTGLRDVDWIHPGGGAMENHHWHDPHCRCVGLLLAGDAGRYPKPDGQPTKDDTLLIVFNAHTEAIPFTMPQARQAVHWVSVLDTDWPERPVGDLIVSPQGKFTAKGRSVNVFALVYHRQEP